MLIECPDCGRKVSDRAKECPDCSCPVAEVLAERRAEEERAAAIASRRPLDREVDCPRCEARGCYANDDGTAAWCTPCEHSGRLILCVATDGYFGVARYAVERFLAGELHAGTSGVVFFVGASEPTTHRFEKAAPRHPVKPEEIPW
ncbi:MAG: hypothetical protein M5U28_45325 [Sandaracinaceae bacterium]|nr:hypothetical protein [Sandaracinaceae bacterium]